ncbi:hypothetical protein P8452_37698 [Trifolium repens]|nr:hypothetical protein P8452_37698 [Trifolium repens]
MLTMDVLRHRSGTVTGNHLIDNHLRYSHARVSPSTELRAPSVHRSHIYFWVALMLWTVWEGSLLNCRVLGKLLVCHPMLH